MVMEPKYYAEKVIGHPNHQLRIWRLMPREFSMEENTDGKCRRHSPRDIRKLCVQAMRWMERSRQLFGRPNYHPWKTRGPIIGVKKPKLPIYFRSFIAVMVSNIVYFHPYLGKMNPILTSIFFRWVGSTTNQKSPERKGSSSNHWFSGRAISFMEYIVCQKNWCRFSQTHHPHVSGFCLFPGSYLSTIDTFVCCILLCD